MRDLKHYKDHCNKLSLVCSELEQSIRCRDDIIRMLMEAAERVVNSNGNPFRDQEEAIYNLEVLLRDLNEQRRNGEWPI